MDPIASAFDSLKGLAKSGQDMVSGLIGRRGDSVRRRPIEILKRLQREAFSDIMKLRDRQDKVERVLSFYKTSKESPFQEANTRVKGEFDVVGGLLKTSNVNQQICDALSRAGIRAGVDARFTFKATARENDTLDAQFIASQRGGEDANHLLGSPTLSLAKVVYKANLSDWFSMVALPVGAQCRDVCSSSNSFHLGKGLSDVSRSGPPLMDQPTGSGIGLTVRKSNVLASLAHFVSGLKSCVGSHEVEQSFSTFGQVTCQLPQATELSLLGLHQIHRVYNQHPSSGLLSLPLSILRDHADHDTFSEASGRTTERNACHITPDGSVALLLESALDENMRLGGWMEIKRSNSKHIDWAVNLSDDSTDELGWGLSLSGTIEGQSRLDRFQAESYVKFNLGNKLNLRPGIVHVMDGNARLTAFMVRSSWSL